MFEILHKKHCYRRTHIICIHTYIYIIIYIYVMIYTYVYIYIHIYIYISRLSMRSRCVRVFLLSRICSCGYVLAALCSRAIILKEHSLQPFPCSCFHVASIGEPIHKHCGAQPECESNL